MPLFADLKKMYRKHRRQELPGHLHPNHMNRTRMYRYLLAAVVTWIIITFLYITGMVSRPTMGLEDRPPLYSRYHQQELLLPQHDPSLPFPEGRDGKFLWLPNHVHKLGWGNAMQELFLNAYLAHITGRIFVFDNYTWNRDGPDYTWYNGRWIPSRVPLTALIDGPIVGAPFPEGISTPRAVVKEYYDILCPKPTIISKDNAESFSKDDASASTIMYRWEQMLLATNDPCMEVDRNSDPLFDYKVFGSAQRLLDIWPALSQSLVVKAFLWSPLIHAAFDKNVALVSPSLAQTSITSPSHSLAYPYILIPGLMAIHIRRGDFDGHCLFLAKHSSTFTGFSSFPSLIDRFEPPPNKGWNNKKKQAYYMPHCFPDIQQIVTKIEHIRQTVAGSGVRELYIMTNAASPWISNLKTALAQAGTWDRITSSKDMILNWEQKYVAQTVDMLIGQRAQVFIGNGFSSLTSNVVMLRLANNFPDDTIRFW